MASPHMLISQGNGCGKGFSHMQGDCVPELCSPRKQNRTCRLCSNATWGSSYSGGCRLGGWVTVLHDICFIALEAAAAQVDVSRFFPAHPPFGQSPQWRSNFCTGSSNMAHGAGGLQRLAAVFCSCFEARQLGSLRQTHLTTVSPTSFWLVLLPTWPPPASRCCYLQLSPSIR